jgi:hypothetical protein
VKEAGPRMSVTFRHSSPHEPSPERPLDHAQTGQAPGG